MIVKSKVTGLGGLGSNKYQGILYQGILVDPCSSLYFYPKSQSFTYDHRTLKTRLPVRSALFKQRTGGLVVRWVTTGESPLLYVFFLLPFSMNEVEETNLTGGVPVGIILVYLGHDGD
jgi:hypothetical protein